MYGNISSKMKNKINKKLLEVFYQSYDVLSK